jgi:diguanylate cyclase (GGDEF)-like protein
VLHMALVIEQGAHTPLRPTHVVAFGTLLACAAVCIEASRRLGMPAGVARDLLSAWWLPVALLLPPFYALLMPIPLQALLQFRVRRTLLYRRVFVTSAMGLAGAAASVVFHLVVPDPLDGSVDWVIETRPAILVAIGCAALFIVVNTGLVAIAAHSAAPETRWRDVLWNRESLMLDVVELCVGVIVAITCTDSLGLLLLALPPVVLLQRSLLHQQLRAAARTDAKTGLLNAVAWQREADGWVRRARRAGVPAAVLLLDIDHFKRVNDRYGHLAGDELLAATASTLISHVRAGDVLGRFGGEEFVALLPGSDQFDAARVAERLRKRIEEMHQFEVPLTISIGVAQHVSGEEIERVIHRADAALLDAKGSGRNRVVIAPTIELDQAFAINATAPTAAYNRQRVTQYPPGQSTEPPPLEPVID